MTPDEVTLRDRLSAALAAEHAAIFAYGRLGVLLDAAGRTAARDAEATHRARRDAVLVQLTALQATPPAAAPGYDLPFPLDSKASAVKLAAHVETGVAATWRAVLGPATGEVRRQALVAFTDAAVRATRWRRLAGATPGTVVFPGRAV